MYAEFRVEFPMPQIKKNQLWKFYKYFLVVRILKERNIPEFIDKDIAQFS